MKVQTLDWQFIQISVMMAPRENLHSRWAEELRKVLKKLVYTVEGIKKMM